MTEEFKHRPSSVSPGRPGSEIYPTTPLGEKFSGIATGRDVEWEPLVDFRRMDVSENTIHGAIAWAHGDEICLLYTSPSPRDRTRSRMPSSA